MKNLLGSATALAALTFAAPAFAFSVWPDVDFQWYADVGKYDLRPATAAVEPAPREGYIWSPERWETRNGHPIHIAAHWVVDDYAAQLAIYNRPDRVADVR